MKRTFVFYLLSCLLWTSPGLTETIGKQQALVREVTVKTFSELYRDSYLQGMEEYAKSRHNPKDIFHQLPLEQRQYFYYLFEKHKIKQLPKWEKYKDGHRLKIGGREVFINPALSFARKISVEGKVYPLMVRGKNFKQNMNRLRDLLEDGKISFFNPLNILIPEAQAIICGGLCIALVVSGVVGAGVLVAKNTDDTMRGNTGALDEKRQEIKEAKQTCSSQLRNDDALQDENSLQALELIDKLGKDLKRFDIHYSDRNKKLHATVYEAFDMDVDSCQKFSEKYRRNQGALSQLEAKRSLSGQRSQKLANNERTQALCREINDLVGCLYWYDKRKLKHDESRRKKAIEDLDDSGLFDGLIDAGKSIFR